MSDPTPDEALIDAFRGGDEEAFSVLYRRHSDRVTSYAWRMMGRREEAEEIAVEAFARVVEGAWRPSGSFKSFLFTVVHRLCLDRLRRRARAFRAEGRIEAEGAPWTPSPEDAAAEDSEKARLDRALAALPEAHRSVLLLYYGQDLTSREVADVLGCDDQQVRSRLSYARRLLREQLDAGEKVLP